MMMMMMMMITEIALYCAKCRRFSI